MAYSQGGVQFPTGGKQKSSVSPRAPILYFSIWMGSADPVRFRSRRYSPDAREDSLPPDNTPVRAALLPFFALSQVIITI